MEGRERFASQVLEALNKVPEGMLKSLLLESLAQRSGLAQEQLKVLLEKRAKTSQRSFVQEQAEQAEDDAAPSSMAGAVQPVKAQGGRSRSMVLSPVGRIVQLLLHEPNLVGVLPDRLDWLPEDDDTPLCQELIELLKAGRYRSPQVVLAHFQGSQQGQALAAFAKRELLIPKADREAELIGWVEHLQHVQRQRSPQEEYAALLAQERAGQKLDKEQRQRLASLVMQLAQR